MFQLMSHVTWSDTDVLIFKLEFGLVLTAGQANKARATVNYETRRPRLTGVTNARTWTCRVLLGQTHVSVWGPISPADPGLSLD